MNTKLSRKRISQALGLCATAFVSSSAYAVAASEASTGASATTATLSVPPPSTTAPSPAAATSGELPIGAPTPTAADLVAPAAAAPVTDPGATIRTTVPAVDIPVPKRKVPKMELAVGVSGRRIDDRYVRSNTAGPSLELTGTHSFNEKLSARLVVGALLSAGTASSLFTTEGQPSSFIFMNEAAVTYKPIEELSFRGGVLDTRFSSNPSIFSSKGFPGVSEGVKVGGDKLNASLSATQTMPTASGLSKNYTNGDQQPYLLLHTAAFNAGDKDALLGIGLSATHFMFGDLPANAAQDSRFVGNTVTGLGAQAARFAYGFSGYEGAVALKSRLNRAVRLELKGAALRNTEAPEGKNIGYTATFVPTLETGNLEFKPEVGYFRNESDTLPATYTSSGVGQNNRQGILAGASLKFKEENIVLKSRWVQANEIQDNPFTADRTIVTVALETSYDIL